MKFSSSFRRFMLLGLTGLVSLFTSATHALDITGYYLGSCRRVIGIPVGVDREVLRVLTLEGRIKTVPRYEVNLVATYPSDSIQIDHVENPDAQPPIEIVTRRDRKMVNLVTGWPVEFTEDKVSFLAVSGEDFVVDRDSIWQINETPLNANFTFRTQRRRANLDFVHPQLFADCPSDKALPEKASGESRRVVPQQILAEPVTIKREFDRLMRGHGVIEGYRRKQQFYAVPSIYKNQTSLILWTSIGSRYGSSNFRSNNFTPLIRNEESSGPFSYQHEILTGSGPNVDSTHEEPQTQASYRFKADYFQFSAMSDLSFLLVGGARYRWSKADLGDRDFRLNDVARLSAGIDYGHFSMAVIPVGQVNTGVTSDGQFDEDSVNLVRYQIAATYPDWTLSFTSGGGDSVRTSMKITRLNFSYKFANDSLLQASFISRNSESKVSVSRTVFYDSQSRTFAVWYEKILFRRMPVGLNVAYENYAFNGRGISNTANSSRTESFLKAGVMFGLIF